MQHKIRWQVEAVKSGVTGLVLGFGIVSVGWQRGDDKSDWCKVIPDDIVYPCDFLAGDLDSLSQEAYMTLLKMYFITAFRMMNRLASDFVMINAGKVVFNATKIGLNWCEHTYEELQNELDRRTSCANRVSDDSGLTRTC